MSVPPRDPGRAWDDDACGPQRGDAERIVTIAVAYIKFRSRAGCARFDAGSSGSERVRLRSGERGRKPAEADQCRSSYRSDSKRFSHIERATVMLDIEKLIREVYVRNTIWDQNHPQHHNREAVQKLWAEIAESCDTTVQAAKTKWKNLRDCFRTEYKKQLKGKSGDASNDSPTPPSTWLWYRDLLFLKDQIGTKRKVQNFPIATQEAEEEIAEPKFDIYYDDIKVESMDSTDDGISRDSHCQSTVASASSQLHPAEEYLRRRIPLFTHENFWNAGLFPFGNLADDDSYHFLMSLHKPLNSLPNEREMFIRYKIQELLYNEIFRMH